MDLLLPIALVLVGLVLVIIEVKLVPGTHVIGVAGMLGMAVGIVIAFVEFGILGGLLVLVGTVAAAAGLLYVLWESGAWDTLVLTDSLRRDADADRAADETRAHIVGQPGTAVTPLRPSGVAEIGGERLEVTTEGAFVASGSRLRVVAIDRRRTIVRLDDARPDAADAAPPGPA